MKKFFKHSGSFSLILFYISAFIFYQGRDKNDIAYPLWGSIILVLGVCVAILSLREIKATDKIINDGQHFTAKVVNRVKCVDNSNYDFFLSYTNNDGKECMAVPLNNQLFYRLKIGDLVEISILDGNCIIVKKLDS